MRRFLWYAVIWVPAVTVMVLVSLFPWFSNAVQIPLTSLFVLVLVFLFTERVRSRRQPADESEELETAWPSAAYVIMNGVRYPVIGVRLANHSVQIQYEVEGPADLDGPITVFGDDGIGCWQAPDLDRGSIPAGRSAIVTHRVVFHKVTSEVVVGP